MSTLGAMGTVGKDEEDPSPSLSLLQRLKRLREWQERQREELLQTQAYTHTPRGPYLPPLQEETSSSLESTVVEESPSSIPQRVEDHFAPTGLPGVGPPSPVVPVTSNLQVNSAGIEDVAATPTSTAVPQGSSTPAGHSGAGTSSSLVPVASYLLVKSPVRLSKEVTVRLQGEETRESPPIHDNLDMGKMDAVGVRESEREVPPFTSSSIVADTSHTLITEPEDEGDVRGREDDYDTYHTTDTQGETHSSLPSGFSSHLSASSSHPSASSSHPSASSSLPSASSSLPSASSSHLSASSSLPSASLAPSDPSEYMDDVEDFSDGEKRAPYRSEKYRSPAPSKEDFKAPEPSQALKNPVPSRPFFSSFIQGSEGGPEGMEETPKPRRRFLKKGEGTARFRMRPMRLRKPRTEAEEDCGWQGGVDAPQTHTPARTPARSQFRLPVGSLQLDGERSVDHYTQGTSEPMLGPTQYSTHPARPTVPIHHPTHPARPPLVTHQSNQSTFPPSTCPTSQNHPRPSLSIQRPIQTTENPARPPPIPYLDLEKQQRKEEAELSAFEKLEELAEDSSFSSNSSTVLGLLRQGQLSVSSTPMRTPPPLANQETPVVGPLNARPKNLESQFLGSLVNRILSPASAPQHQQMASPVDVKKVLAQLKSIVRLEGHSISNITESDIQSYLDGCSSNLSHQPLDAPHPTSTPLSPQPDLPPQARPHHVHFASEGVQVLEYQLSDTDGEETLTDAPSLDSDMITTSDLEALTQFSINGAMPNPSRRQVQSCRETNSTDASSSDDATLTEQEPPQESQPVVLHFSPPPPRPPQSASNYIWSIFGKERDAKKLSAPKPASKKTTKVSSHQPPPKPQEPVRKNAPSDPQMNTKTDDGEEEIEVVKTLLLAKVAELEKETKLFKKDNAKLQKLQQEVKEEREKLEEEKRRLHEEAAAERRRFQEYVDRERNALWSERQRMVHRSPSPVTQPEEHLMEVIRLKDQVREMEKEAQRKESLSQFTAKKLNDRIKVLEKENKKLHERNSSLEKENQDLRLKVDRTKASGRTRPVTQPAHPSQPGKATRGRPKTGTRPTTVDGVAKALDRLTEPQPVIIKEAQTKPSRTSKQDAANNNNNNNNMRMEGKQESSAKPPPPHTSQEQDTPVEEPPPVAPHTHMTSSPDSLQHDQPPLWSTPSCTEEAGLEHTEKVTEDGVREVIYANGNRKEIHPNGDVMVSFYNGDRKEVRADRTVYVYGSDHTTHTTYYDGREELVFPSGQRETRCPDGSSEISFPDGSRKSVTSDGTEICTTKDGSIVRTNPDGSKVFEFPSGQREVHRGGEKRREYPNGTVKIVHPDGRTETRYNSGRIRIRDREGNVILDTHVSLPSPPPPAPHSSLPS